MISILITAYKEEKTIGKAIQAFKKQKLKQKYEIIVAAPDQPTLKQAKKHRVKTLQDPCKGKPHALNLMLKKSKGNIVVLSDGDVYVSPNSLSKLISHFKNPKIGAVTARPVSLNDKNTFLGYASHLLTDQGAHLTRSLLVKQSKFIVCSGYYFAFKKNLIEKIPQDALSEDAVVSHFIWKKGYKIAYEPRARVYVKYPDNLEDWLKQKLRSAGGYNQIKNYVKNPKRMRSFWQESTHIWRALTYPKNTKEAWWTFRLIWLRLYLWIKIYWTINVKKKEFKKVWVRIESTK